MLSFKSPKNPPDRPSPRDINPLQVPIPLLRPPQNLPPLLRKLRPPLIHGASPEEDWPPHPPIALPLPRLLPLRLLEIHLYRRRLGVLLGEDRVRDAGPEREGLVGELLLAGREDLWRDRQGRDVDYRVLGFLGVGGLWQG